MRKEGIRERNNSQEKFDNKTNASTNGQSLEISSPKTRRRLSNICGRSTNVEDKDVNVGKSEQTGNTLPESVVDKKLTVKENESLDKPNVIVDDNEKNESIKQKGN